MEVVGNELIMKSGQKVRLTLRPTQRLTGRLNDQYSFYTSPTFYGWAFEDDGTNSDYDTNFVQIVQPFVQPLVQHNIEIKIKINTQEEIARALRLFLLDRKGKGAKRSLGGLRQLRSARKARKGR